MPQSTIRYTIEDDKGQKSSLSVPVSHPANQTAAADSVYEYAVAFAHALDAVILGRITSITVTMRIPVPASPGVKGVADPAADVEEGVLLKFATADNTIKAMRLPTFNEGYLFRENPDMTIGPVVDLLDLLTRPAELAANWTVSPTDARGAALASLLHGVEHFKASRS